MRTISRTAKFKKDYKREGKGQHRVTLDTIYLQQFPCWSQTKFCLKNFTIIL
jgi:hypothetical protein